MGGEKINRFWKRFAKIIAESAKSKNNLTAERKMNNRKTKNIILCFLLLLSVCLKNVSGISKNKNTNVDISAINEGQNGNLIVDKRQ